MRVLEKQLATGDISTQDSIKTLHVLSRNLAFVNPLKSLEYANLGLKLSTRLDDAQGIANAYRILSAVYSFNESYFISMDYLQRSLDIFEDLKDSVGIANCYISLGHTYRRLKQRDEEIKHHKASYDIFTRIGFEERIGVTAHNLGESYYNIGNLSKSRELTQLAISINDSLNNQSVLSSCFKVMGLIELKNGNLDMAKIHFNKVLEISERLGENSQKVAAAESMLGLANVFQIENNSEMQKVFLIKAAEFSKKYNLANFLQTSYQELIAISSRNGDTSSTAKYLNSYKSVRDSIENKKLQDRYNLTKTVIQVHELSKEKINLEKQNLKQSQQLQERTILVVVVSVFLAILIWLLLNYKSINQSLKKRKQIIESQNVELKTLNNTKDKFFSIVAHDLKSPLISLESFSSLLIDQFDDLTREQIAEMSKEIKSSVSNTIKMAENLITWAMVQMKDYAYSPEHVRLDKIIQVIYKVYADVAFQKGVQLKYEVIDDLLVNGDKNQIAFIIRNLVNNAIKFTEKDGIVEIRAFQPSKDQIKVSVTDSGIGIKKERINTLFTLGESDSTKGTNGEKGTGLGLMLCLDFLKMNNGNIEIDSEVGKGSSFTITFKAV